MIAAETVAAAFRCACEAELLALKPGNVHFLAPGHGMTVADFKLSAEVSAPWIAARGMGVGERVWRAVAATRAACGQNTNLGILLLAAPLAVAAERPEALPAAVRSVLEGLTVEDAAFAYRAIRHASPGGLGRSDRHDVAEPPVVTLLEAMREAAGRDGIAAQYASGFEDVLGFGLSTLGLARAAGWPEPWCVTRTFMAFLARLPDTHILRKHGAATAAAVVEWARPLADELGSMPQPAALTSALLALDARLKGAGINPGTTADLTVAVHFAAGLGDAAASARRDPNP